MAYFNKSQSGRYKTTEYRDVKTGTIGKDSFSGYGGNDSFIGYGGNDVFSGGSGNDTLNGGSGNDFFNGGSGSDKLIGGSGADIFYFRDKFEGVDTITDFDFIEGDKIMISKSGFGASSTSQFNYNFASGDLSFNDTKIANLSNKPNFVPKYDIELI